MLHSSKVPPLSTRRSRRVSSFLRIASSREIELSLLRWRPLAFTTLGSKLDLFILTNLEWGRIWPPMRLIMVDTMWISLCLIAEGLFKAVGTSSIIIRWIVDSHPTLKISEMDLISRSTWIIRLVQVRRINIWISSEERLQIKEEGMSKICSLRRVIFPCWKLRIVTNWWKKIRK